MCKKEMTEIGWDKSFLEHSRTTWLQPGGKRGLCFEHSVDYYVGWADPENFIGFHLYFKGADILFEKVHMPSAETPETRSGVAGDHPF